MPLDAGFEQGHLNDARHLPALKGIPEPEEENVAKQGSSVDFRVGEEATHTVDLNKATSEKEESEEEDPNKENSREEDFEQETDV